MKIFKIMSVVNITSMLWSIMYIMHTCTENVKCEAVIYLKIQQQQHMFVLSNYNAYS